ncbi:MAG: HAD family hydrolase [Planctomycetes bacterium]|nr:HAD family hydrolase [Planctomycetota bacterium]
MLHTIDTVLFDLDGTLTAPVIDFADMKVKLGLPPTTGFLIHAISHLPADERAAKEATILREEINYARRARPNRGTKELVDWLHGRGIKTAIVTRNHPEPVEITLGVLGLRFDVILHRNSGMPTKPAPDAVVEALRRLGRAASRALMVGDYVDDITSGRAAGTRTCYVTNGAARDQGGADLVVEHPEELLRLFQRA